jgi:hypothetical protein
VLCASALLAGLVGVYRMRSGNVFANILTEPLYTSISLLIVLARGDSHLARVPIYLGSDLINLVPGILLPNKERLMQEIPDVYSPLGAINSYVSFEANFGVLGTAVFIFLFAWGTRRLRRTPGSWRTPAYVMISGWSGFALFRDPFAVSLVKDILEFSILMPAAICALSFWLRWSCGVAPGGVNISAAKQVDQGS